MKNFMKSMRKFPKIDKKMPERKVYSVSEFNITVERLLIHERDTTGCSTIREDGQCSIMKVGITFT
jgi:hypothetical protein